MKFLITLFMLALPASAAAQDHTAHSAHAGKQTREIKALSNEDVAALLSGAGMGYALSAELNHYPGPRHVLDMRDKLGITAEQEIRLRAIFKDMNAQAIELGTQLVQAERELDGAFATRTVTQQQLEALTARIAALNGRLRSVHLAAHLTTTALLTDEQVRRYDVERGYQEEHHK